MDQHIETAKAHAKAAGLRYVYDTDPGLVRRRRGKGFSYHHQGASVVRDTGTLERCRSLAVPPAWTGVWICAQEAGHIQATGYDARGRKQYRYHAGWRVYRDDNKFSGMLGFGHALPGVRRRVLAALNRDGLPKDKVIAAVVRLLDNTGLRVGNDAYTAENHTYGLTTICKRHVELHGTRIQLDFPAKGGKVWRGTVLAPKVASVIAACEELPGYRLFKFVDDSGASHAIASTDVNAWLQDPSGLPVTAKDFRTWTACTLFLDEGLARSSSSDVCGFQLAPVLKAVSRQLGNTPAILKKSYVHAELVDLYRAGCLLNEEWRPDPPPNFPGLRRTEGLLLTWLERRYGAGG